MDPNKLWDDLLMDMSILFDLRRDPDYKARLEWAGESEADLVEAVSTKLENLAEWVRNGGALPVLTDDA